MPTSRRIASMLRTSSVSSIPSTMMSPRWWSSSRLMVRMNVDLPDPDGPKVTNHLAFLDSGRDSPQRVKVAVPLVHVPADDHVFRPLSPLP